MQSVIMDLLSAEQRFNKTLDDIQDEREESKPDDIRLALDVAENGFVIGSLRNADSIIEGGESDYGQAKKYGRNAIYGRGEATLLDAQSF